MFEEGVTVGAEGKRHVEGLSAGEGLLHTGADRMGFVLGLDDGNGHAGFVVEHEVSAPGLPARNL